MTARKKAGKVIIDTDWVLLLLRHANDYCTPNSELTREQLLHEMKRASNNIKSVLDILQKARYG